MGLTRSLVPDSDAEILTALVAADTTTGGFVKDDQVDDLASGFLYGLTLANNGSDATNDIDIAAGRCIDSTNAVLMSLSALTKRLDAGWAAGTNQGMRNSAAAISDGTYHIYAVCKAAGADPDIYAHTSATVATVITALQAETGGSAYLYARRIGSILRSTSIRPFDQYGDRFILRSPVQNISGSMTDDTAALSTVTTPLGIKTTAILAIHLEDTTPAAVTWWYISSPDSTDVAASSTNQTVMIYGTAASASIAFGVTNTVEVVTDTSSQVRRRSNGRTADHVFIINTIGWVDTRGRLG